MLYFTLNYVEPFKFNYSCRPGRMCYRTISWMMSQLKSYGCLARALTGSSLFPKPPPDSARHLTPDESHCPPL